MMRLLLAFHWLLRLRLAFHWLMCLRLAFHWLSNTGLSKGGVQYGHAGDTSGCL
jgi:hypothetical protein